MPKRDKTRVSNIAAIPFRGGAITAIERALIPNGGYSMIQNMRNKHPGLEQRAGFRRKHTTALTGTPKILSLHQFSKGKRTERHFFAQASDDDIYEATDAPPTVTAVTFGTAVFTGTATSIPASWGNIDDHLIFSNGKDQHQIYAGTDNYVKKLMKFSDAAAVTNIPTDAYDLTKEVTDGDSASYVELDSLSTYAAATYECLFIYSPVPINRLYWTFITGKVSDQDAIGTLNYWKGSWADTTETDGTIITTDKTMSGDGAMTWTHPTDEIPKFMFGICGYWYQWVTNAALGADVQVSSLTYGSSFSDIANVWDGVPVYAIEARFFDNSASTHALFATNDIEIDDMVHSADDSEDRVYWNSIDPIIGIYVDVGETPNLTTTTTIPTVKVWTGEGYTSVGTVTDGTNGLNNSGWITWPRPPYSTTYYPEPTQFQTSRYYSYWYYFCVATATLSDNVRISIETMPYFDIGEAGEVGQCNAIWKDRAVYSLDRWPQYGFVSAKDSPLVLNGNDYGILAAGDGRSNKWAWAERFKNELVVAQEEKGKEGGCVTLFEGRADDPTTFGKLLLSSKIGGLNAKSVAVVDGVLTSTRTDEIIKDLIFWISHKGVIACDGKNLSIVSDDIQNYFDPTETECIRRGYDSEHWLEYDSSCNCLRLGLVSGSSATTPNIFPVFDLIDKTWSFDVLGQNMSCMTEVEAASGDIPILQYGGGVDCGNIYQLNYGTNDISTTDLITNGTFASDTGWTKGTGWTIAGGVASCSGAQDTYSNISQTPGLVIGNIYRVSFTLSNYSAGEVFAQIGDGSVGSIGPARTADGTYHTTLTMNADTGFAIVGDADFIGDIDNVICTLATPAIDAYATMELDAQALYLYLREMLLRIKGQTAGDVTITPYLNAVAQTALTLSMIVLNSGEEFRRHRMGMNYQDSHISLKFQNATISQALYLLDVGFDLYAKQGH